ncbi:MAG: potassium-transporting ATPase subunit KdpC [Acidobacteriota bacterium]|nr:potassium-transporting ATPase subunit KdpC [Acidobacteriota bacterium]
MREQLKIAFLMTVVTTVLLGIVYPLVVTGMAQVLFHDQANGQLIERDGKVIGSRIIGQPFTGPEYFHSRPSAAGNGYDGLASGGTNWGATNKKLIDRVAADLARVQAENPGAPVPIDLVTASASGLDPHTSVAAADFQIPRIARERGMNEAELRSLISKHAHGREMGFLGEGRVNVVELNLELDQIHPRRR